MGWSFIVSSHPTTESPWAQRATQKEAARRKEIDEVFNWDKTFGALTGPGWGWNLRPGNSQELTKQSQSLGHHIRARMRTDHRFRSAMRGGSLDTSTPMKVGRYTVPWNIYGEPSKVVVRQMFEEIRKAYYAGNFKSRYENDPDFKAICNFVQFFVECGLGLINEIPTSDHIPPRTNPGVWDAPATWGGLVHSGEGRAMT